MTLSKTSSRAFALMAYSGSDVIGIYLGLENMVHHIILSCSGNTIDAYILTVWRVM